MGWATRIGMTLASQNVDSAGARFLMPTSSAAHGPHDAQKMPLRHQLRIKPRVRT